MWTSDSQTLSHIDWFVFWKTSRMAKYNENNIISYLYYISFCSITTTSIDHMGEIGKFWSW